MKTVREAINKGAKVIYCNNGLRIELPDRYESNDWAISPPKMIQGKPVFRWLVIRLSEQDSPNVNISAVRHRPLFNADFGIFQYNEYLAKEKEVNELISDNGGIDTFYTRYWLY